jgi:hypothetical protein
VRPVGCVPNLPTPIFVARVPKVAQKLVRPRAADLARLVLTVDHRVPAGKAVPKQAVPRAVNLARPPLAVAQVPKVVQKPVRPRAVDLDHPVRIMDRVPRAVPTLAAWARPTRTADLAPKVALKLADPRAAAPARPPRTVARILTDPPMPARQRVVDRSPRLGDPRSTNRLLGIAAPWGTREAEARLAARTPASEACPVVPWLTTGDSPVCSVHRWVPTVDSAAFRVAPWARGPELAACSVPPLRGRLGFRASRVFEAVRTVDLAPE